MTAIEVTTRLERTDAIDPLVRMVPLTYPGAWRVSDRIEDLPVVDADGAVPIASKDEAIRADGFPSFRTLTAERPVRYPVTVTYRARVQPPSEPAGPALGPRASAGGVSGAGGAFLVMNGFDNGRTELLWDLSDLPKG